MQQSLNIERIYSFDDITSLRAEWDHFIESNECEIFLTFDWCRVWWKYYGKGRTLFIYIFRSDGRIRGILPIFLEEIGVGPFSTRVVKLVASDYAPVTMSLPLDRAYAGAILRDFLSDLQDVCKFDMLYFGAISGRCMYLNDLYESLTQSSNNTYCIHIRVSGVQTYFPIAENWEQQLETLHKSERKKLRREYKRHGSINSYIVSNDKTLAVFDEFVDMHQQKWQNKGYCGHFVDWPKAHDFHKEIIKAQLIHDRLRILQININDICIGYKYAFKFADTYLSFLDAHVVDNNINNIGYSRIMFGEQVKHAQLENVRWIDSMRGYYEHKMHLGGQLVPIHDLFIYHRLISSTIKIFLLRLSATILDIIYYKVWRRRILRLLSLNGGSLLKLWIRTGMFTYYLRSRH